MAEGQPQPENAGNGKNRTKSAVAVWIAKHLGVPTGLVVAIVTWGSSWVDSKQQEFKDAQKDIIELREELQGISKDIEFLQEQKATDRAQWRAIQRVHDKMDDTEVTAKANEIILDKFLDDKLQVLGRAPVPDKKPDLLDRVLGRMPKKPPLVVRRAPPKKIKTVEQYMNEQVQQHQQEQMQLQRPEK